MPEAYASKRAFVPVRVSRRELIREVGRFDIICGRIVGDGLNLGWSGCSAMKVMLDLCVVPIGVGVSLSEYIVECERVLKAAGLKTELHAYGTIVEGEWDEVFAAVKACHEAVHAKGAPRITTTIKVGTRVDREQTMEEKVASVREKLS